MGHPFDAVDGFGILSMASIGPIISVLTVGLWVRWKIERKKRRYDQTLQVGKLVSEGMNSKGT